MIALGYKLDCHVPNNSGLAMTEFIFLNKS
jgi:hypothetical protein